jgi:NTE family protein
MFKPLLLLTFALLAACATGSADYKDHTAPRAAPIAALKSERPLIALALGSGGARGFAHVGVIKALEEAGIVPDIVTGSSSGAVVAALYAAGHNGRALEELALSVEKDALLDFTLFGKGWVLGEALQEFVNDAVGGRPLERLARPFAVMVTRARDGAQVVFNRGDTGLAVRASASVPNLFIPPVIRGEEYVDGGLTTPVPVRTARAMGGDVVIAVDVSWFAQARASGAYRATDDTSRFRSERYLRLDEELKGADVVIIPRTTRTRMLDFEPKLEHIAAGEEAARVAIPRILELIARVRDEKRPGSISAVAAP